MVLCWGLPLKRCQIIPCCQYNEAVSQMAPYCRFSRDITANIQYVCWSVLRSLFDLKFFFEFLNTLQPSSLSLLWFWPSGLWHRVALSALTNATYSFYLEFGGRRKIDTVHSFESSVKNYQKSIMMPETRAAKKIFKWDPLTTRPRGRSKHRWEDIIQDLGQMKIKNWITCVQDRAKWKAVVEKAKTSNWGGSRAWIIIIIIIRKNVGVIVGQSREADREL